MGKWKKLRLWLSHKIMLLAQWVRPEISYEEASDEIAWWLAHDKKQREFTKKVLQAREGFESSGDDGKMMQDLLDNYDPKKEAKFGGKETLDQNDWE